MEGWIKIHRKILENPIICKDSDYLAVWIYLLANATHKEIPVLFKGEKIILKPGQLITGRKSISEKLKISESKIYRIINEYKSEQQIEQQTSNKNSLITILNWDKYQQSEQQNETQMNNKRTTTEQQLNTNKNNKNIKNEKNEKNIKEKNIKKEKETEIDSLINSNFNDEQIKNTIYEFIKMRKAIKKPLTTRGLELLIKKLYSMTTNIDEQIEILNNSIMNNWQGIFPLKQNNYKKINGSFDDFKDLWEEAGKEDDQTRNNSSHNSFSW